MRELRAYKKLAALFLCIVLALAFVTGCANQNNSSATSNTSTNQQTNTATQPADDVVKTAAMNYFANLPDGNNAIKAPDFFAKIDSGEDMVVLDIRQATDYQAGHIKGAVNVPYGTAVANSLELIPSGKPVYVYCYTGQTAAQTMVLLNIAGKQAKTVQGGFNNGIFKTDGYEKYITTEAAPALTGSYPVDTTIKAAIVKYYDDVVAKAGTDFQYNNISPANVKKIIDDSNKDYFILSVRQAADYQKGHLPTAVNIPFGKGMQENFSQLPKDKKIICYCYTGQTGSQTMAVLRLLGYDAYNMSGGMGTADPKTGWLGEGYPTVTD